MNLKRYFHLVSVSLNVLIIVLGIYLVFFMGSKAYSFGEKIFNEQAVDSDDNARDKNPLLHLNSVHKERDIPDRYLQRHGYGHRQGWTLEHPH